MLLSNFVPDSLISFTCFEQEAVLKFRGNVAQDNENTFKFEYSVIASHPTLGKVKVL